MGKENFNGMKSDHNKGNGMDSFDQPDLISPAVAAYYHIPAVWCGESPTDNEWGNAAESELIKDVFRSTICDLIGVRVRRDGLFVFDFSKWPDGSVTEIPGYKRIPGKTVPKEVTQAELLAEKKAHYRILILNVHQACISSAHLAIHRRSTTLGQIVASSRMITFFKFEENGNAIYHLTNDPFQRYLATQTTLTLPFRLSHPETRARQLLELDTITYSFSLLEKILNHDLLDLPILIDMLYRAAAQFTENLFADCLILCWTVCERLLNAVWDKYVSERKILTDGRSRVNRDRLKKLTGINFTASIISETLELAEYIPTELFNDIDKIRKNRNDRLHNLRQMTDREASNSIRTTEKFLEFVTGIKVNLSVGRTVPGTGGMPKKLAIQLGVIQKD